MKKPIDTKPGNPYIHYIETATEGRHTMTSIHNGFGYEPSADDIEEMHGYFDEFHPWPPEDELGCEDDYYAAMAERFNAQKRYELGHNWE